MIILSHRGYWKATSEKNSQIAFDRSFSSGFGLETDIRDFGGELVVSHDIPVEGAMPVADLFETYSKTAVPHILALNVKADGLQEKLKELLLRYGVSEYFVFDMSVAEGLSYLKQDFKVFTRQSEYEKEPPFYESARGVWLDEFHSHWITRDTIERHLCNGKQVCIVSPELHGRSHLAEWTDYKNICIQLGTASIILCTDLPAEAKEFFNG